MKTLGLLGVAWTALWLLAVLSGCSPLSSAVSSPASSARAQTTGPCRLDAECTLVDLCGCTCRAELGRAMPPVACSEACGGTPCVGHRAVCRSGTCVME